MNGAQAIVATLKRHGVDTIYTLSGHQILAIYDACLDAGIRLVATRHEAAAVLMADAHAQLSGGIGVALVSAGPGTTNAASPLYAARKAESPVLLLSGDTPLALDGRGDFQSLDQVALTASLTKTTRRCLSPNTLAATIDDAIRIAMNGRPGPVHVVLPMDVIEAQTTVEAGRPAPAPSPSPVDGALDAIAAHLPQAERPLILLGPALGPGRAPVAHETLAGHSDAPVVALGSPRGVADPALGDLPHALAQADLVVALGKTIDFAVGFGGAAPDARWIVIEPDAAEREAADRNLGDRLVACIDADPAQVLRALAATPAAHPTRADWRGRVAALTAARHYSALPVSGPGMDPQAVCEALIRIVADAPGSILVSDGGEFGQWVQAILTPHADRRIINGPSANIGSALPHAIGARMACPDAPILAFAGDGGIGFHFAEFETAMRCNAPLMLFVGSNDSWLAEQDFQRARFGDQRLVACDLRGAAYGEAAAALGAHGEQVASLDELLPAVARARASGLPACIDLAIARRGAPRPAPLR